MAAMMGLPALYTRHVNNLMHCDTLSRPVPFLQDTGCRSAAASNSCKGSKKLLLSQSLRYILDDPAPRRHNNICVSVAASSGEVDPVVSIQFGDEVNVTSEPFGEKKLKVKVNLTSKGTQKALNVVLAGLSKSAPPVKGFRKGKGGKSLVPRDVLYQMLGPSRVDRFIVEETVTSTVLDHVKREDIKVKKDFKTVQSTDELIAAFKPGEEFGFEAILELEDLAEPALIPALDG